MCEKLGAASAADKATYMKQDEYFLTNYLQNSSQEINQECDIEYLQRVAQIRLCLDRAAELLFELHGTASKWAYSTQMVMQMCRTTNCTHVPFNVFCIGI